MNDHNLLYLVARFVCQIHGAATIAICVLVVLAFFFIFVFYKVFKDEWHTDSDQG